MTTDAPPPEAYGRVTNPERFAGLHQVADDLLDRFDAQFQVERTEGLHVDTKIAGRRAVDRVVRLSPTVGDGAPLTIAYTSFPGLCVRYGRFLTTGLPHCGCDACNEDPQQLTDELTRRAQLLADGKYSEEILPRVEPPPGFDHRYVFGGGLAGPPESIPPGYEESWGGPMNPDYVDGEVHPMSREWGPWIRR